MNKDEEECDDVANDGKMIFSAHKTDTMFKYSEPLEIALPYENKPGNHEERMPLYGVDKNFDNNVFRELLISA